MKAVTIAAGLFFFIFAPVSVFGQAGIITTHGGNGTAGYSGDGGPATSAPLNQPAGIALDFSSQWLMDGFSPRSSSSIGAMPVNASVAGVGDFNADGKSDILWRSVSGDVSIWLMDGPTVMAYRDIGNIGDRRPQ